MSQYLLAQLQQFESILLCQAQVAHGLSPTQAVAILRLRVQPLQVNCC